MVDSVAGSVVGNQLQGIRAAAAPQKVEREIEDATDRATEARAQPPPERSTSSDRGNIVNIKV